MSHTRTSTSRISPIDCARAREDASAELDGELDDRRALAQHLDACDSCREHAERLRSLTVALAPLADLAPRNASAWHALETRARTQRRARVARPLARAAAGLVGFALTFAALRAWHAARNETDAPSPLTSMLSRLAPENSATAAVQRASGLPEHQLLTRLFDRTEDER